MQRQYFALERTNILYQLHDPEILGGTHRAGEGQRAGDEQRTHGLSPNDTRSRIQPGHISCVTSADRTRSLASAAALGQARDGALCAQDMTMRTRLSSREARQYRSRPRQKCLTAEVLDRRGQAP